jgi:hypothetical protein
VKVGVAFVVNPTGDFAESVEPAEIDLLSSVVPVMLEILRELFVQSSLPSPAIGNGADFSVISSSMAVSCRHR